MLNTPFPAAVLPGLALALLAGCSTLPPNTERSPRDPWEKVNRTTFKFNTAFDRKLFRPIASGYVKVTPRPVRTGVSNFFDNITYPTVIVNDALQGQVRPFFNDVGRFLMNTVVGIGGIFDPATPAGLDKNDRDFGQTFGKWGVGSGPYVVLPFIGPSDVRDGVGLVPAIYTNGLHFINNSYVYWPLWALDKVDLRSRLLGTDNLVYGAYDPYSFMRNAYLQRRDFKVKGGAEGSPGEQQEEDQLMKDADEAERESGSEAAPGSKPGVPAATPGRPAAPPQPPPK